MLRLALRANISNRCILLPREPDGNYVCQDENVFTNVKCGRNKVDNDIRDWYDNTVPSNWVSERPPRKGSWPIPRTLETERVDRKQQQPAK